VSLARIGRIVVPGLPHHVTQRGNRRQPILFEPGDHAVCRDLLAQRCRAASVEVWGVLFDAQPRPSDSYAPLVRRTRPGDRRDHRPIGNIPVSSMLARAGPVVCFSGASRRWSSTRTICWRLPAMLRSTRCAPGWSRRHGTGRGRARGRISTGGTTNWSVPHRDSTASDGSPFTDLIVPGSVPETLRRCGLRKAAVTPSAPTQSSLSSNAALAVGCARASRGASQVRWLRGDRTGGRSEPCGRTPGAAEGMEAGRRPRARSRRYLAICKLSP